jgi:uncharacterized membrane protein YdjX (TVP38/TMEM64 family)
MKNSTKNIIKTIIILCISIVFIYLIFKHQKRFSHLKLKNLRSYIISFGPYAAFIFIFLYSIKPVLIFFPALVFTAIAGNVFGPINGFFLTVIGLFTSSTFAFYLSRSLGKPFVAKITGGKLLELDENIEQHGFKLIFLMRLSTLFPYDPLSYAAGLTKISYKDFITATIIGSAPEMLAYTYVGHNMRHPSLQRVIIPVCIIVILALIGSYIYKVNIKLNK